MLALYMVRLCVLEALVHCTSAISPSSDKSIEVEPSSAARRTPSIQQLAEAEHGDEHPGVVDLAGLEVKPLDRIAGIVHFHTFAGGELAGGDARLAVLREPAVELLPKIGVGRQDRHAAYPHILNSFVW